MTLPRQSDRINCYALHLAGRLAILLICFAFCIFDPGQFDVLRGVWVIDMAALTCPACTDKLCTQYCCKLRPKEPA